MNSNRKFIPIILSFFAMCLMVTSGFGMYFYWNTKSNSLTLNYNDTGDDVIVDDIAENYSFGQDLSASNYYDVYFFCQPYAAFYKSFTIDSQKEVTITSISGPSTEEQTSITGYTITFNNNLTLPYYSSSGKGSGSYNNTTSFDKGPYTFSGSNNNYTYSGLSYTNGDYTNSYVLTYNGTTITYTITTTGGRQSHNDSGTVSTSFNAEPIKTDSGESTTYYTINGNKYTESSTGVFTYSNYTYYTSGDNAGKLMQSVSGQKASDPVSFYDYQNTQDSPSFANDKYGFWGHLEGTSRTSANQSSNPQVTCDHGSSVYNDSTDNMTKYGYKKFTNVYKKFSTTDYNNNKLSQCATTYLDKEDSSFWAWNNYFVGFTSDVSVAQASINNSATSDYGGTAPSNTSTLFNINKPLSEYDTDGDKKIYFYAIYTTGATSSNSDNSIQIIRDSNTASDSYSAYAGDVDQPYIYQWIMLQSSQTNPYFISSNIYVKDAHTSNYDDELTFYKSRNYKMNYKAGAYDGSWASAISSLNSLTYNGKTLTETLITGSYYNFYAAKSDKDTLKSRASLSNKTIVFIASTSDDSYSFAVERIYDYRMTGDVAGNDGTYSSDESGKKIQYLYQFSENTDTSTSSLRSNTTHIYETNEISFFNTTTAKFAINFNQIYDSSIFTYKIDPNAPESNTAKTGYECYQPKENSTDANVFYKNPSAQDVYYETSKILSIDDSTLIGDQQLPVISMRGAGTYKFRIIVTYSSVGVPAQINISAAFLRGKFIEIHKSNPTKNIFTGTSKNVDTGFIDHTDDNPYMYIASFSENSTLHFKDEDTTDENDYATVFYEYKYTNGKYTLVNTTPHTLEEIVGTYGTLIDHVDKRNTITSAGFCTTINSTSTTTNTFTVKKNYVYYCQNAS